MHGFPAAELPEAGVGLVVQLEGPVADPFQGLEILDRRGAKQPLVEEGLHGRKHDLAEDIILHVLVGLVADPHRPHAAVALEVRRDALGQHGLQAHPVDRLHPALLACTWSTRLRR